MEKAKFGVKEQAELRAQMMEVVKTAFGVAGKGKLTVVPITEGLLVSTKKADVVIKFVVKKERVDVSEELEAIAQKKAEAEKKAAEKAAKIAKAEAKKAKSAKTATPAEVAQEVAEGSDDDFNDYSDEVEGEEGV